ncbi:MAG TPA: type II toxin-antitoxin system RelE/ParE family toxin [Stellaceae bacterium]|jgi:toxin ParE1/3/4|nr:type II toxin-antitoxin system RelE/ParE family toxin [Stellaceae bacterium]
MAYRTTRQADQDIIDIYLRGCREFGQPQAERYHAGLAATLELIADNPRIARERTEFNPPVRLHPYQSHMIVYLLDDTGVLVVRVLYGRQDWESCL